MNREMKLLARKLTALFLSIALVLGLAPGNIQVKAASEFSYELLDYQDTYYNGFNDDVAVAKGTFIELTYGYDANYIPVEEEVKKVEGDSFTTEITLNDSDMADAEVVYESGDVYLKVILEGEEVYKEKLYTPKYVDISQMPAISLNQEVSVTDGVAKYCEQYYRIDLSSLPTSSTAKVFTLAIDDDVDDYSDTYIYLYDGNGRLLDENDDGEEDYADSVLTFEKPATGERIVGVKGYNDEEVTLATLKLVAGAQSIVSFESDNIDRLNVFYEGFNDDVLYATGTRIVAALDNGTVCEWQSYGYWYDYDEDYSEDFVNVVFGDVEADIYRGDDGAVYVDYRLYYGEDSMETKKLYTPIIKPVSDIPEISEGETTINTLPWDGAYSYYRITAEEEEVWNLHISYAGDDPDYWDLGIDGYEEDGTFLFNEEQEWDDDAEELMDLDVEITVPAGSTRIIGIYDYADESQEFTLTATKMQDEQATTPEVTTPEVTTPEVTTPEVTTPEVTTPEVTTPELTTSVPETTTDNNTVVATTTKNADQQKIDEFTKAGKAKVKDAAKKKSAKKIKISLKKTLKGVNGYQVRVYKNKKNAKKNKKAVAKVTVKKNKKKFTVKHKKLANKKTLFIRVRGYIKVSGKTYTGKWSKVKKVKIKK